MKLAELSESEWYDVVASEFENDPDDTFQPRISELKEHAAQGNAMLVDYEAIVALEQIANSLKWGLDNLDDGKKLAEIEKDRLLPACDKVRTTASEEIEQLS